MDEITPQDLNNSKSVLDYLKQYAIDTGNKEMELEIDRLIFNHNKQLHEQVSFNLFKQSRLTKL